MGLNWNCPEYYEQINDTTWTLARGLLGIWITIFRKLHIIGVFACLLKKNHLDPLTLKLDSIPISVNRLTFQNHYTWMIPLQLTITIDLVWYCKKDKYKAICTNLISTFSSAYLSNTISWYIRSEEIPPTHSTRFTSSRSYRATKFCRMVTASRLPCLVSRSNIYCSTTIFLNPFDFRWFESYI